MEVPRLSAALAVFVLITALSLAAIGLVSRLGPIAAHGNGVEHQNGKIIAFGPGTDFTFRTNDGQVLHFQCHGRCLNQLQHMQRHITEKASTDVYYTGAGGTAPVLVATDVD